MSNSGLYLAIEVDGDGAHPAAWRRAAHAPDQLLTPRRVRSVATIAENAGFTLATVDDDLLPPGDGPNPAGRIGAVERAAFIAAATSTLGVAPTVSTTYTEPFHVSSQLASIDHISTGRAGWAVSQSAGAAAARAWGRPLVEDRAREARDSTRVVRDLWDSWEDDAVIRDVATSRYLDRDRLHYIDFTGETFAVKGPAIVPRPPQGQLVVFAPEGLLPADLVDVTLTNATARAATPLTFTEIEVALDTGSATAAQRIADLGPWPDRGRLRYTGPADGLIKLLTDLAGAVDGARLHPLVLDEDLAVLSRLVVPALLRSRIAARPVPGASLRTTLGLARPASRFQETAR
ncbi:LLM class flavin-dependent oxidoreductase [Kutzneria sp. CA-103260]|uniref:LLM class flavin-dependent oxidoreductase n=1 Tax=Kutzneria sp. CA-103260 TaxID=2802641 RepID=UPI001BAD406F|nr:LLM class flavin-dependent oxidoreductase [Kutzneria sp. CA-103260]QUQ65673.1 LLM class flavin-dependent oxidoreductase [Kutzneria sp. CA-103260]